LLELNVQKNAKIKMLRKYAVELILCEHLIIFI